MLHENYFTAWVPPLENVEMNYEQRSAYSGFI
jgi:hypothetical protein